jgi:transposase-like protein
LFVGTWEIGEMAAGLHGKLDAIRKDLGEMRGAAAAVPDSVARGVFAVVHSLESEGRWRKAPMLQVFRLYCIEGLTATKTARRCGCSKSLVTLRLRLLQEKLGRDPAELRQMSSQFEEIEDSLGDPRAKRINRRRAMEGHGQDEEDTDG